MGGLSMDDAERLSARNEGRTLGQKLRRWFDALPSRTRKYGQTVLSSAAVFAVYSWETRNGTLGFEQEFRAGIGWSLVAAMGCSLTSLLSWRWAMESFRDIPKDPQKIFAGGMALIIAILSTAALLFGVWSSFASEGVRRLNASTEVSDQRKAIQKDITSLENEARGIPQSVEVGLDADRLALQNTETLGRQWDLPKLDSSAGGDCDADLKPFQRTLCIKAADLRADIKTAENMIALRASLLAQASAKKDELLALNPVEGSEQYQQVSEMSGGKLNAEQAQAFGKLGLSIAFLLMAMYLFDKTWERLQTRGGAGQP